jgi:hypothetical protein
MNRDISLEPAEEARSPAGFERIIAKKPGWTEVTAA